VQGVKGVIDMLRIAWVTFVSGCLLMQTPLLAATRDAPAESHGVGDSRGYADGPRCSISIARDQVQLDVLLDHLSKRHGFTIGGLQFAHGGEPLALTMRGSLRVVLQRLLRNRNYLIVHSSERECGIERVVVINGAYGAPSHTPRMVSRL
jgi:hypothetical protein